MENQRIQEDLESIRHLMERSVKFISLSGLSGILAGIYALIGAALAYYQIYSGEVVRTVEYYQGHIPVVANLIYIALVVLVASLLTGLWFSHRKAKRVGTKIWNAISKRLLINLSVPLVVGGIFILFQLMRGHYSLVASSALIFYGLALINSSSNLYEEMRYLGYCELIVGLVAAAWPGYGLYFWAIGFGLLHILYGSMMYHKYDR
jgi:fumarate reductase subunit D